MLQKISSLFVLLSFVSFATNAQKNLKEAIVVFDNSDTAKGYLDYKEWLVNPVSVLFTKDKDAAPERLDVTKISYFNVVALEQYKRYTVRVSMDPEALSAVADKDTSSETRTVFLKILQEGKNVSLFSYKDGLKRRLYLLENDATTPAELLNSIYMQNSQIKEEKQYRLVLNSLAVKYIPSEINTISKIDNAGYYSSEIADICAKINGIEKQTQTASSKVHEQAGTRFFVSAGVNQGTLIIEGNNNFAGLNSHPFYAPVGAVGVDLVLNPAVGKLVLRAVLHATSYKTDAYASKDFGQYTEEYFLKFRQVNVALTPQLLYTFYNQKNFKWFAAAGVGFNFSSYPLNEQHFIRKSSTNVEATDDKYIKGLKKFWMNGCVTTGVDISRLELAVLYFPKASITQTTGYGVDNSSLQLRLSFFIKK